MINILLVDTSKLFRSLIKSELYELNINEFTVHFLNNYEEAFDFLTSHSVDIILSEMDLGGAEKGLDFLDKIRSKHLLKTIPFIFTSENNKDSVIKKAYDKRANDYFKKPLNYLNYLKIRNIIDTSLNQQTLKNKVMNLSKGMDEAVSDVRAIEKEVILRLAKAAALRDKETGNHIHRVGQYSYEISKSLGLPIHIQECIEKVSPLHDVGKIAIPDSILQKPGKLTAEEYKIMKNHTIYGYKVLYNPDINLLKTAAEIALNHHEFWDGSGYPYGRKGDEIPIEARITTVADVFDAISSKRRYKAAWTMEESFQQIIDKSGTFFDKNVVEAFLDIKSKILDIHEELKDIE